MNLFEWMKLTKDLCSRCRSNLFNYLSQVEKDELIDSVSKIHDLYDMCGDEP